MKEYRIWDKEQKKYINTDKYICEKNTGRVDCVGNPVFNGDVLEVFEDEVHYVVVKWDDENEEWRLKGETENDYSLDELVHFPEKQSLIDNVGVVGNIRENPELLEKIE